MAVLYYQFAFEFHLILISYLTLVFGFARYYDYFMRVLFDEKQIHDRVQILADMINSDYKGQEVIAIGVLKGAVIFYSELVRKLKMPLYFDFIQIGTYGASKESSGKVRVIKDIEKDISGKHLLIIEDIIDTGFTLDWLIKTLKERNPASIKIAVLLDKKSKRKIPVKIDYIGFESPDEFVVGYGLDFDDKYRELPYIGVLK